MAKKPISSKGFNVFHSRLIGHAYFHVIDPVPGQDLPLYIGQAQVRSGYRSDARASLPANCAGIMVVVQGQGTALNATQPDRSVGTGTVMWYDTDPLDVVFRSDGDSHILSTLFTGDRVRGLLAALIAQHGAFQTVDPGHPLIRQALAMTRNRTRQTLAAANAQALVDAWVRLAWPVSRAGTIRLHEALLAHLSEPDPVSATARSLDLSREHLSRLAKTQFGCPARQWIHLQRLEQANLLLATGDQTVTEVATQVGFASPTAFTAAFRGLFGLGPSAWRQAQRRG